MPLLIATIATVLLSAAALAVVSVAGWLPDTAAALASPAPAAATADVRARASCAACGFVQSVRRVAPRGEAPGTYEITVRLRDGSTRVHTDAAGAHWRPGERIVFIAGERLEPLKTVGERIGK